VSSQKDNIHPTGQEMLSAVKPKVHYLIHKSQQQYPVLCQMNPHTLICLVSVVSSICCPLNQAIFVNDVDDH